MPLRKAHIDVLFLFSSSSLLFTHLFFIRLKHTLKGIHPNQGTHLSRAATHPNKGGTHHPSKGGTRQQILTVAMHHQRGTQGNKVRAYFYICSLNKRRR